MFRFVPDRRESAVVGMTLDQVLRNENASGAKFSIAMSGDRIASIDFVALVTRWIKQRSTVERGCRAVVFNRACFAGEFSSGNDVNSGHRQEKHVGRLNQKMSGFSLGVVDLVWSTKRGSQRVASTAR